MSIQVLDHGYVKLIECYGTDSRIIEAARMSTDKGFQGWDTDAKLLAYLYNNKHMTPFEMAGCIFEIKAPIFVFREWHRHRTQSYNEMSARYVPLPNENYIPTVARVMAAGGTNKQAQGSKEISSFEAQLFVDRLASDYDCAEDSYQKAITTGVPKELARLILPVGRYSKMRAAANLRNWFAFLTLRDAPNAQWEIQQYAKAVGKLVEQNFPRSYALFQEMPHG